MEKEFPLKKFRDRSAEVQPIVRPQSDFSKESLDKIFGCDAGVCVEFIEDPEFEPKGVKIAGFGGQGVLSMGLALAQAAFGSGRYRLLVSRLRPGAARRHLQLLGDHLRRAHRLAGRGSSGRAGGLQPAISGEVRAHGQEGRTDHSTTHWPASSSRPEGVKAISVPATQIATEKGAASGRQHGHVRGADAGRESGAAARGLRKCLPVTFAKKPKLIPLNLEILEAGAQAVKVLEMVARK